MNWWLQRSWAMCFILILAYRDELAAHPENRAGEHSDVYSGLLPMKVSGGDSEVGAVWSYQGAREVAAASRTCIRAYYSQSRADTPKLVVGVYNFAEAPGGTLRPAQEQASEIFGRVGINLRWVDCPVSSPAPIVEVERLRACQQAMDFRGVFLRIISERMVAGLRVHDTTLAVAIPPGVAIVMYQRTRDLATHLNLEDHAVLGPIIAHELGHLLLGDDPHSTKGIMAQELSPNDFRPDDSRTILFFAPRQVQIMKARLRDRILLLK